MLMKKVLCPAEQLEDRALCIRVPEVSCLAGLQLLQAVQLLTCVGQPHCLVILVLPLTRSLVQSEISRTHLNRDYHGKKGNIYSSKKETE